MRGATLKPKGILRNWYSWPSKRKMKWRRTEEWRGKERKQFDKSSCRTSSPGTSARPRPARRRSGSASTRGGRSGCGRGR